MGKHIKTNRFLELEGARGIAAIVVVVAHYLLAFYPSLVSGRSSLAHTNFETSIHGTPLALLYAGTFAVAIFFVLSGFVLSIGYFQTKNRDIVKKLAHSRYLRLMIPALVSVVLAYILIKLGFGNVSLAAGNETASWFFGMWAIDTSFLAAVKGGVFDIFVQSGSPLNSVLWTMYIEFLGSSLIFITLFLFAESKYRWILYGMLAIFTFNTWFLPFILGLTIADLYANGYLEKFKRIYIIAPLLIGGLLLGSMPHKGIENTAYAFLTRLDLSTLTGIKNIHHETLYLTIAATMVILAVLLSAKLSTWLSRPRIASLGKYTFSLYLTHLLVLLSFSSALFMMLHESLGYNKTVLVVVLASLPVLWGVTVLFERYVDAPSVKFSKWVGAVYRGEKAVSLSTYCESLRSRLVYITERIMRTYKKPEPEEISD